MDNLYFISNNIFINFFKELTKYNNDYQQYLNYICKDQRIQRPKPTLSSEWYSPALAQINKFVRERNKQQKEALSEDENKGEGAYIIEQMS